MKRFALTIVLILTVTSALSGAIPDNSTVRRRLSELMLSPVSLIGVDQGRIMEDQFSRKLVKFEVERTDEKLYLIFLNQRNDAFPLISSGNFILRRDLNNGAVEQIKIYLDDIGALVLRIAPMGFRSQVSLSLFDDELYRRIPIGVSIEQIIGMDINRIMDLTAGIIAWDQLFPAVEAGDYRYMLDVLSQIRQVLPSLPDAEDGAMDEFGNLVRIETLRTNDLPGFNCSGFAKFLADGIYAARTGGFMSIEALKTKHPEYRGNDISLEYEDERDPYFGLDWTRNIAVSLAAAAGDSPDSPEFADVRHLPWYSYREDLGYAVEHIIPVMYLLALRDPGKIYLGSINGEFGSDPVLWQHYHVVVFFPYFDDQGNFRVAVLERNVESSLSSLQRRYPREFVHLVALEPAQEYRIPRF